MELKKSYRGFVLLMLLFVAGMVAVILLPVEDGGALTRLLLGWTSLFVALMTFVIWRTEQVYWYNGTEYEAAVEAGSKRRRAFAWRHFRVFGWYALGYIAFSCAMHLTGVPWWIDIIVFGVGLCAAAVSTVSFKL